MKYLTLGLTCCTLLTSYSATFAQTSPSILNGSMSEGTTGVTQWSDVTTETGQAQAVRDTKDFKIGPASLRLESVNGSVQGAGVSQKVQNAAPGQRCKIAGYVKAAGEVNFAAIAVITPGADTTWHQLISFANNRQWTEFSDTVTIPENAQLALIMLFMHGQGSVWLDELSVQPFAGNEPVTSPASTRVITEFNEPFNFAYLAFENATKVVDGVAHIASPNGKGGAGVAKSLDLTPFADHAPAIWAKVGPDNKAKQIKMFFANGEDAKRMFSYSLQGVGTNAFVRVLPLDGLAVSPALTNEDAHAFDPAKITMLQVQGDWTDPPVDVLLDKIELVAPTEELRAMRTAYAQQMAQQAEQQRRDEQRRQEELTRLLANAPHPEDGPQVLHVGAVAPNILAVTIEDGTIHLRKQYRYSTQPTDEIRDGQSGDATKALQWRHSQIVDAPKERTVMRKVEGSGVLETLGSLIKDDRLVAPKAEYQGVPLTIVTVDQPQAYRIGSTDDPAFATASAPAEVFVKCLPTGQANNQIPLRCIVYLKTGRPLQLGATYTIEFRGVNTRQEKVTYRHDPRRVRSDALHATQLGYRPHDPFKRAYLSTWLGTGGSLKYDATEFELLDDKTGQSVYRGSVEFGFAAERPESMRGNKNQTLTNVYYLDFHDFQQPGTYRVYVPGVGVSYPLTIEEQVWQRAFTAAMHGFLSHRNGIALGPPTTDYERPRPMHPADGVKVFELDVTYWNGEAEAVDRSLRRLLAGTLSPTQLTEYPHAWGGYMDAGDWDRRSQHLHCTLAMLELCDLFPTYFAGQPLALPASETEDQLPDLLNEALWNLDCYRRLQRPDGGVGGGIESTSHPKPGEASWQESLLLGTFAPDPETSLRYAACAARAARLLSQYDQALANVYRQSAERAWTWANANQQRVIDAAVGREDSRTRDPEQLAEVVRKMRALAAVELLQLTEDVQYEAAFRKSSWLGTGQGDAGAELDALFAYARLPDRLGDPALKQRAQAWFEQAAQESMEFARQNAFNITCRVPQLPMIGFVAYYSAPETSIGCVLPRAHFLTGKQEYLAGALAATQFTAGANPMNMTLTTGIGHRFPRHPLHVDSQHAGIEPPKGITVYGNSDPSISDGSTDWAHTWFLSKTMIPASRTWPAAEFYVDLGNWPVMNEYTVHQTLGPVAYYWGYLAAQKAAEGE